MKLYVGNLSRLSTEDAVKSAFEQFGQVASVKIILDRETRESRGFAFVDMPDNNEAQQAIEQMNGKEFEGRKLTVNEAREPERTGGGGGRPGGFGGDRGPRTPRTNGGGGGFRSRF